VLRIRSIRHTTGEKQTPGSCTLGFRRRRLVRCTLRLVSSCYHFEEAGCTPQTVWTFGEEIQSLKSVLRAIASYFTHSNTLGHLSNSNIMWMIMTIMMMIIIIITELRRSCFYQMTYSAEWDQRAGLEKKKGFSGLHVLTVFRGVLLS
jgi:hypothetical protein